MTDSELIFEKEQWVPSSTWHVGCQLDCVHMEATWTHLVTYGGKYDPMARSLGGWRWHATPRWPRGRPRAIRGAAIVRRKTLFKSNVETKVISVRKVSHLRPEFYGFYEFYQVGSKRNSVRPTEQFHEIYATLLMILGVLWHQLLKQYIC